MSINRGLPSLFTDVEEPTPEPKITRAVPEPEVPVEEPVVEEEPPKKEVPPFVKKLFGKK